MALGWGELRLVPANDKIILRQYLEARRIQIAPGMATSAFSVVFVCEQVLKNADLSYDEIIDGIVDGGNDGGIDALYIFVNNDLVSSDFDPSVYRGSAFVELVLVQSKQSNGFSEDAINRLTSACGFLLNLEQDITTTEARRRFNSPLLEHVGAFRSAYAALIPQLPRLKITFYYATEGDEVHPNTASKVDELRDTIGNLFSASSMSFAFLGAAQLLELARRQPVTTASVRISESIATSEKANVNLVPLTELYRLISDDAGRLRRDLFEANVRDYQGSNSVNRDIAATLLTPEAEDFWWLNNGITILVTQTNLAGKTLTLENVQVVNGLQTCAEIHNYFSTNPARAHDEQRQVLVRVIIPDDESSRDRIIKATNSQTYIPAVSLRATDKLQRDIEDYFKAGKLFYDRRKNFYKNEGRPLESIISIPYLAQAIVAIFLQEPDNARARPSTLLRTDEAYRRVFDEARPVEFYLACATFMRTAEAAIRDILTTSERNNFRFQFAMLAASILLEIESPSVLNVIEVAGRDISDDLTRLLLAFQTWCFKHLSDDGAFTSRDQIAKSSAFTELIKDNFKNILSISRGEMEPWFDVVA